MTLIAQAVEPLRADAVAKAVKFAEQYIAGVFAGLEAAGWDLTVYAPIPSAFKLGRNDYLAAQIKARHAYALTESTSEFCRRPGQPNIVKRSGKGVEKFLANVAADASAQYDLFISKLNDKVGAHSGAALVGSHVWGYSFLTVTTDAGAQVWKTQQIVNVSKLGKVFNQWPTRLVK